MNILVLTPFFSAEGYEDVWDIRYDPQGGMQLMTSRLCLEIERQMKDANIDVVTIGQPNIPVKRKFSAGITVLSRRFPIPKIKSRLGGYCGLIKAWAVSTFFYLLRNRKKYDVIFAHADGSGTALLLYYLAKKLLAVPLVLQIHSSRGATQTATTFFEQLTNGLAASMELKTVSVANAVYTLSDQTTHYFVSQLSQVLPIKKLVYLPDIARFLSYKPDVAPGPKKDKFRILYLGRVSAEKGCDVFLEIAKRLDSSKYHIVFCGDGPELERIKNETRKQKTEKMFDFLGFVDHAAVPQIIHQCDVGIVPSEYEELGIVILELMASGKSVIAHNLSTVRQLIKDGVDGLLVPKGDIATMCEAIERVCTDTLLRTALEAKAYEKAKRLSSIETAARTVIADMIKGVNQWLEMGPNG